MGSALLMTTPPGALCLRYKLEGYMTDVKLVRNVAILGHGNCGKTTLAEAMLFSAGKTNRLGKVDDGSSTMDFEPEEIKRDISISASFNHYTWNKHEVFLADTPWGW